MQLLQLQRSKPIVEGETVKGEVTCLLVLPGDIKEEAPDSAFKIQI